MSITTKIGPIVRTLRSTLCRGDLHRHLWGSAPHTAGPLHVRGFCASAIREKRVLGAIAHINSGKTTTSEAMLYTAGALRRMGNVDVGDTALDFLPAERERGITINSAAICFNWKKHEIFLVDSPGHLDFTFEVERALKVMDGVIVLLDAVAGVQPQTETVWRQADSNGLSRVVFVNKMDREGADFEATVLSLQHYFSSTPCAVQIPIFDEKTGKFYGVYDLLERFNGSPGLQEFTAKNARGDDVIGSFVDLSPQQQASVRRAVDHLVETVAEVNDDVMEHWLDGTMVPFSTMLSALRRACVEGTLVPVLCGSSLRGIGVESLLDSVIKYLPSPLERSPVTAVSTEGLEVSVRASEDSPFLAYAFKVSHDKHRGKLVHLRAFCGSLEQSRRPFFNTTKAKKEMPTKILRVLADKYVEIDSVATGDIFAAVGLRHTETGDTLVLQHGPQGSQFVLSGVKAPPPVFSVALEVDSSSQERDLAESLRRLVEEDCSLETKIDEETGETLLSGMGELHLEVAVDRMSRNLGFPIRMSRPRVAYRETVTEGIEHVEIYDTTIGSSRFQATMRVKIEAPESKTDSLDNVINISNEIFDVEAQQAITGGIEAALGRGPLLGTPISNVHISVFPVREDESDTRNDVAALRACASRAVQNCLRKCKPRVLEPVMRVDCIVPNNVAGEVISEISHPTRRRGIIDTFDVTGGENSPVNGEMSAIKATVPLEGMIGWATKMRSITKGRGDFSTRFSSYRLVDEMTQKRLMAEINGT